MELDWENRSLQKKKITHGLSQLNCKSSWSGMEMRSKFMLSMFSTLSKNMAPH
jgi:hypothetical protein